MRAHADRSLRLVPAGPDREHRSERVDMHLAACSLTGCTKPVAHLAILFAQRQTANAALGRAAEFRGSVDVGPHPVRVDVEIGQPFGHVYAFQISPHSFTCRRRAASRVLLLKVDCPGHRPMGIRSRPPLCRKRTLYIVAEGKPTENAREYVHDLSRAAQRHPAGAQPWRRFRQGGRREATRRLRCRDDRRGAGRSGEIRRGRAGAR